MGMKRMRKILVFLCLMALILSGCGDGISEYEKIYKEYEPKIKAVTDEFEAEAKNKEGEGSDYLTFIAYYWERSSALADISYEAEGKMDKIFEKDETSKEEYDLWLSRLEELTEIQYDRMDKIFEEQAAELKEDYQKQIEEAANNFYEGIEQQVPAALDALNELAGGLTGDSAAAEPTTEPEKSMETGEQEEKEEISADLREFLDGYEQFVDNYVAFMKKYYAAENPMSLLTEYTRILQDYSTWAEKIDDLDEDSLSAAEVAYYIEVTTRCSAKMLSVLG